jgi:hypothetical protein
MLVWAVGFYGFTARWRWLGGIGYAAATAALVVQPILH